MNAFVHNTVIFLTDMTVRATAILAMAVLIAVLSKRASAAFRHLVWTIGLAAVLCLPLLCRVLPNWHIALMAPRASHPTVQQSSESEPSVGADLNSRFVVTKPSNPFPTKAAPIPAANVLPVLATTHSAIPGPDCSVCVLLIWVVGFGVASLRLTQGLILAGRIGRRGTPINIGPIADAAEEARALMQVSRPVALIQANAADAVTVPLTYGAQHPVIVLPATAPDWPPERLRAALLHELAHVQRKDFLTLMFAYFARAIYWFHPLAWLAETRLRAESETASDDLVLAAGMPSQNYARHLLDVALTARAGRHITSGAVAMAQSPRIEGRLRSILSQGMNRNAVKMKIALRLLAIAILLVLPIAVLHPEWRLRIQRATSGVTPQAAMEDATKSIPGGGTMQLAYISNMPSAQQIWWGSDGRVLSNPPSWLKGLQLGTMRSSQRDLKFNQFIIEALGLTQNAEFDVLVPKAVSTGWGLTKSYNLPNDHKTIATIGIEVLQPASVRTGTVRIGVADGPWRYVSDFRADMGGDANISNGVDEELTLELAPPALIRGNLSYTVSDNGINYATRLVAIDLHGKTLIPDEVSDAGQGSKMRQRTLSFPHVRAKDIRELQFQVRPYTWIEFRDIPLQPLAPIATASTQFAQDVANYNASARHVDLGDAAQQIGLPRDGIPEFRKAVAIDPENPSAQFELANALNMSKNKHFSSPQRNTTITVPAPPAVLEEAIRHLRIAVALQPYNIMWHSTLGGYFAQGGRDIEAVAQFRQALRLLPPVKHIQVALKVGDPLDSDSSNLCNAQTDLAGSLLRLRQYQEATLHYRQALKFRPSSDNVLLGLGDALNGSGYKAEARTDWKKVVALDGTQSYYGRLAQERLAHDAFTGR